MQVYNASFLIIKKRSALLFTELAHRMLNLKEKLMKFLGPAADMVCPLPATDTTLKQKTQSQGKVFTAEARLKVSEFDRQGLITSATLCTNYLWLCLKFYS